MPAFTFEKISPARRSTAAPDAGKKRRGLVVQILDRFSGPRVERSLDEKSSPATPRQTEASKD
jgi:hypothetical protein